MDWMIEETCKVKVDHTRPLQKMIEAGNFTFVDTRITQENFPAEGSKGVEEVEVSVIWFDKIVSTEDVEDELRQLGFRSVGLWHLLALAEQYPDLQHGRMICAFGSIWVDPETNCRYIPNIFSFYDPNNEDEDGRGTDLEEDHGDLGDYWRFLAVRI